MLTNINIFKWLSNSYCISGQSMLCRKENGIIREYNLSKKVLNGSLAETGKFWILHMERG